MVGRGRRGGERAASELCASSVAYDDSPSTTPCTAHHCRKNLAGCSMSLYLRQTLASNLPPSQACQETVKVKEGTKAAFM